MNERTNGTFELSIEQLENVGKRLAGTLASGSG